MWIEVTTLVLSNAATGAIAAYLLNRRLERRKMLYSAGARFFESVGKAMDAIMLAYRNMAEKSQEIARQLRESTVSEKLVDNTVAEFRAAVKDYQAALAVHRLYLTPLIPFGGTKAAEGGDPHAAVITANAAAMLLRGLVRIPNVHQPSEVREECLKYAEAVQAQYKLMGEKVIRIVRWMSDGRDPFDIKWELE